LTLKEDDDDNDDYSVTEQLR